MKMVYVLVGAVAAAAAVGGVRSFASSAPPPPAPIAAAQESQAPQAAEAAEPPPSGAISGEVLEVIDVPNYSYIRVGAKGTEGSWAAVPTAQLSVGSKVVIQSPMQMTDFKSKALNRTFPVIYFGTLANGAAPHAMAPVGANSPHANGADPHAAAGANGADPHAGFAGPQASAAPVDVKPVPRAAGPNGKTVAEVNAQRTQLVGKTARIHGTVVKVTSGVMGKTYVHLRDGSGDAAAGTNDITVTTDATPKLGDVVTLEGVVATDRDIGSGYKWATIVEDAKLITP